jgi:hypothetical protein
MWSSFIFGLLLWKAIAGLKWSNGILLGAFSIIRRCLRHYTGAFAIIRAAFTIYIRGAFAIIRSGSSIIRGAFNIIRGAFNIIRDAFIQHLYFHILSMTCIWFSDCLNLVCGWQMLFASGLQGQCKSAADPLTAVTIYILLCWRCNILTVYSFSWFQNLKFV